LANVKKIFSSETAWPNGAKLGRKHLCKVQDLGFTFFQWLFKTRGSAHWACIAHLTIEWYWSTFQREIIIALKNSSHLECREF
jgi:hypothetical protein